MNQLGSWDLDFYCNLNHIVVNVKSYILKCCFSALSFWVTYKFDTDLLKYLMLIHINFEDTDNISVTNVI